MSPFATLWLCLSVIVSAQARIHPAFSQEPRCKPEDLNPDWMADIPDDRPLQLLSIPGTHDALALFGDPNKVRVYQTQTMQLKDQLEAGEFHEFHLKC